MDVEAIILNINAIPGHNTGQTHKDKDLEDSEVAFSALSGSRSVLSDS